MWLNYEGQQDPNAGGATNPGMFDTKWLPPLQHKYHGNKGPHYVGMHFCTVILERFVSTLQHSF